MRARTRRPSSLLRAGPAFLNRQVASSSGVVEPFIESLEAPLSTAPPLLSIMSRDTSVRNEIEKALLLDAQVRNGFAALVR